MNPEIFKGLKIVQKLLTAIEKSITESQEYLALLKTSEKIEKQNEYLLEEISKMDRLFAQESSELAQIAHVAIKRIIYKYKENK